MSYRPSRRRRRFERRPEDVTPEQVTVLDPWGQPMALARTLLPTTLAEPTTRAAPPSLRDLVVSFPATLTAQPATVNLNLQAGDDFTMVLMVRDSSGRRMDLSAGSIRAQIREGPWPPGGLPPAPPPLLGSFVVGRGDSEIFLHLTGPTSVALPRVTVWDMDLTLGGVVTTLATGTITMAPEVSR